MLQRVGFHLQRQTERKYAMQTLRIVICDPFWADGDNEDEKMVVRNCLNPSQIMARLERLAFCEDSWLLKTLFVIILSVMRIIATRNCMANEMRDFDSYDLWFDRQKFKALVLMDSQFVMLADLFLNDCNLVLHEHFLFLLVMRMANQLLRFLRDLLFASCLD
jgi:hypothetical protein